MTLRFSLCISQEAKNKYNACSLFFFLLLEIQKRDASVHAFVDAR